MGNFAKNLNLGKRVLSPRCLSYLHQGPLGPTYFNKWNKFIIIILYHAHIHIWSQKFAHVSLRTCHISVQSFGPVATVVLEL